MSDTQAQPTAVPTVADATASHSAMLATAKADLTAARAALEKQYDAVKASALSKYDEALKILDAMEAGAQAEMTGLWGWLKEHL